MAAGGGVAIALLAVTLMRMSDDFDQIAKAREQAVVANGLSSRVTELGRSIVPQAVWDDAVVNLDNRFDRAWAHDNIGTYLHVSDGLEFSWVLDGEDQPLYAMEKGLDVSTSRFVDIEPSVSGIVGKVRQAEASRAARAAPSAVSPQAAIVANTTDMIGPDLFVLSATLVQPDFGTAQIRGRRAPIVVTGHKVDQAFIDGFADRYMLKDAHLHPKDARSEPDEAHVGIPGPTGAVVATLDWMPERPGGALLRKFLPMTLALLGGMLVVALLAYRKAHAATRAVVASEQRAVHIASHDKLTGLGNRRALEERLEAIFAARESGGPRYSLYCLDLDNFKELNDLSGHSVGDEMLRTVARRLRRLERAEDRCFRLDGDEFAVLQVINEGAEPAAFAGRILQTLAKRYALSIGRFTLTSSIGVGLADPADQDAGDLLRKAGLALVSAKREGRARFAVYDPAMDETLRRRRGLQDALRRDLQSGALTMVYQPQVDRGRAMTGVEALVRWTSAEFGPVSPAVFVPLAEECGMIELLGGFTIRRAFEDSLRWPDLKMAVNISALQLRDPGFTDRILALARDTGVSPSGIELELTEGILVDRGQGASSQLRKLKRAGFSIAIDDFGTGYSSLSYLNRFPIEKIKIDRSFVIDMGRSKSADVLVSSIVQLGRSLNMRVIAEGVETADQWLRLTAAGCNEFQGYLASRPVPAEVIDRIYAGERVEVVGEDARFAPEHRLAAA